MELVKWGIIEGAHNVVYPSCFREDGNVKHLFCSLSYSNLLWNNFCLWIGVDVSSRGSSLLVRLLNLNCSFSFWFFGLTFCWSIWSCKNFILFKDSVLVNLYVFSFIKALSWD